jgi:hypothetical protein
MLICVIKGQQYVRLIMDGMNIKLLMPQQAKSTVQYKNTKLKLLQTNAAVWSIRCAALKVHIVGLF